MSIANLGALLDQTGSLVRFRGGLKALTKVFGTLNESREAPKGFNFYSGEAAWLRRAKHPRTLRLRQQNSRRERIKRSNELACLACFCRGPDRCAQEDEILDEKLARIPEQGKPV